MTEISKSFDERLFVLKLAEPARQMHDKVESRRRKVQFERRKIGQGEGVGLFHAFVDSDLDVLLEFLEKDIDRICREVWRTQGNSITAEFVRVILVRTVFSAIETRTGTIKWGIEEMAKRQNLSANLNPVREHLARAIIHLKEKVSNRYEAEARELEYKNLQNSESFSEDGGIKPISGLAEGTMENKNEKVRRVTRAPAPASVLRGGGFHAPSHSKPTQVVEDLPPYYPNNLKPQTRLIIGEAVRKFPLRTHVLELCQYIVSELTQHFSAVIQSKTLRPDQVEDTMNDLLHYILVRNSDNSDESFRIKENVRKSDEWLKLSKEVVRVAADFDRGLSHKDDPRLLPPILQEWEAFKAIKKIITGPHESVPEGFLRGSISRQLGIKPEDVTWKQIKYAVTELFSHYPAITVIPSVEVNDLVATELPQKPRQETSKAVSVEPSNAENSENSNERESFVLPILAKKGWSVHDWATESVVDFHTASDYLKCKTNPYRSTRKKMADSLGIAVENLPR